MYIYVLDTFPVFVYVSGICIRFRYLYTFPVFVYVSGRDPAGNRPELNAFLEASGAADLFWLKKTRSWNIEHAKVSESVKKCQNELKLVKMIPN